MIQYKDRPVTCELKEGYLTVSDDTGKIMVLEVESEVLGNAISLLTGLAAHHITVPN